MVKVVELEKIEEYIDYKGIIVPKSKELLASYFFLMIISIPTVMFGIKNHYAKSMIGLCVVVLGLWTLYFVFKKENKVIYILYLGVMSFFISLTTLIASMKMFTLLMDINIYFIAVVIFIYLGLLIFNFWNIIRLINNGYFLSNNRKAKANFGIYTGTALLGMGIARAFLKEIGNDRAIMIIISGLLFFSLVFLTGTHNFLKFYYIKKISKFK